MNDANTIFIFTEYCIRLSGMYINKSDTNNVQHGNTSSAHVLLCSDRNVTHMYKDAKHCTGSVHCHKSRRNQNIQRHAITFGAHGNATNIPTHQQRNHHPRKEQIIVIINHATKTCTPRSHDCVSLMIVGYIHASTNN